MFNVILRIRVEKVYYWGELMCLLCVELNVEIYNFGLLNEWNKVYILR